MLGAHEVGMLRALDQAGVRPDVVLGTSVGAVNGAFVAADPAGAAEQLAQLWQGEALRQAFRETLWGRAVRLLRSGTHLHSIEPLWHMLDASFPGTRFADLQVPFHCVAASIEGACARWFSSGPLVPAVLASCAVQQPNATANQSPAWPAGWPSHPVRATRRPRPGPHHGRTG